MIINHHYQNISNRVNNSSKHLTAKTFFAKISFVNESKAYWEICSDKTIRRNSWKYIY